MFKIDLLLRFLEAIVPVFPASDSEATPVLLIRLQCLINFWLPQALMLEASHSDNHLITTSSLYSVYQCLLLQRVVIATLYRVPPSLNIR
jgi:hypothetical protein